MLTTLTYKKRMVAANNRLAKTRVSYFFDNEVLSSSVVHLMRLSAARPAFTKRQNLVCKFEKANLWNK